jgi:hypothetical protein
MRCSSWICALMIAGCSRGGFQAVGVEHDEQRTVAPACNQLSAPPTSDVSHYDLPAGSHFPLGVSFATDWANLTQGGGFHWAQVIDGCRVHPDADVVTSHDMPAVRVEVRPNDDPLGLGDNTERAEIAQMQDQDGDINETAAAGTQFYALSYLFPASWGGTQYPSSAFRNGCSANDCNSWSIVTQFYGWAALSAAARSVGGAQQYVLTVNGHDHAFTDGGVLALGTWTDFVMQVNWATGAFSLWRREDGAFTRVVSGTETPPASTMFKHGLYRGGAVDGRTDIFWLGPVARGTSFAAVENEAFGTNDGP